MAFVADFNEEELQRALAAAGGAPTVAEGPGGGVAGSAAPAGPAVPAAGGPPAAGGEGTGFVNLSRYFDANDQGANASANALIDPLKLSEADMTRIGDAGAASAPQAQKPAEVKRNDNDPGTVTFYGQTYNTYQQDWVDQKNKDAMAAYEAEHGAENRALQDKARADAIQAAGMESQQTGRSYIEDPNKLAAGMSKGGQTPSQFDAYLTGAAMPNAYAGLASYYGNTGADMGRSGQGGGRQAYPAQAAPVGAGPSSAPAAMDPAQRKKSKNIGGW